MESNLSYLRLYLQVSFPFFFFPQELRSWEEELTQAALQQKCQEEALRRREQELAEREIHILERELNIIIHQLYREKPPVERRQGKFRRNRLKLKDGNRISLPSGTANTLCVDVHELAGALLSDSSSSQSECSCRRHQLKVLRIRYVFSGRFFFFCRCFFFPFYFLLELPQSHILCHQRNN